MSAVKGVNKTEVEDKFDQMVIHCKHTDWFETLQEPFLFTLYIVLIANENPMAEVIGEITNSFENLQQEKVQGPLDLEDINPRIVANKDLSIITFATLFICSTTSKTIFTFMDMCADVKMTMYFFDY
jgi:hypothetical protein